MKTNVNVFILPRYSGMDAVTMVIELKSKTILIWTSYLAYDYGLSPPQEPIGRLVADAQLRGIPVIIRTDPKSHYTIWRSFGINERCVRLLDFIISNKLVIANRGNTYIYMIIHGSYIYTFNIDMVESSRREKI